MVLIDSFYFNKYLFVQFNSTVGKFVGFNEYGISVAEDWNNSPFVISVRESVDADCRFNIRDRDPAVRDKSGKSLNFLSLTLVLNIYFIFTGATGSINND